MSEIAVRNPVQDLVAQVRSDQFKEQAAMVLPDNVPVSRFIRSFCTAVIANPDIAGYERDSLYASLFKAAQDGLLPDGREAAIVAYKGRAQYLPMIGGVIKIAGEHGWSMTTRVVYANDEFDYELGLNERIVHKPASGDRGDRVYAYAIARHRDGRAPMVDVMDAAEVAKVRSVSRASAKGPWVDWPDRMWEKSVGHRLFKRLPLDPGDKRVARLVIDAEEIGPDESARMLYGPGGATFREIGEGTEGTGRGASTGPGAADTDSAAVAAPSLPDQQAESGESTGDAPSGPAAAPGFQIPDTVVEAAGNVEVQPGWTVAQVCADEKGLAWVGWLLGPDYDGSLDQAVVDAVRLYVGQRHPEILA